MMRQGNYSLVIDANYNPLSMQEMLVPFTAYKDAFEKSEAAYDELTEKADTFKYLAKRLEDNPDSEAARIYKGYADELAKQAQDLAQNGLSMGNRRALTDLKRRYQGEIGQLEIANKAMDEERKLRRQMSAKDSSMLYAVDNLDIDQFLGGNTPNLYSISGNELYSRGAAAGKAASSRVYSAGDEGSTLNGYYRKWVERNGYSKESMDAFRANVSAIPELQQAADAILTERGAAENLTGSNLERARQSVINGIIDGSVYQESVKPVRDAGVMSASERDASARDWAANTRAQQQMELSALQSGYKRENGKWVLDEEGLKKRAEVMGIAGYNPDDWEMGPDGKPRKKAKSSAEAAETKKEDEKGAELMKLDRTTLSNNAGFDVAFGNDRHHYDWVGALSKHGDKWYSGKSGDDNPGHNFPGAWGWASTSNVEDWIGNFTYEPGDKAKMRILSQSEIKALMNDPGIAEHINKQLYTSGFYNNAILKDLMNSQHLTQEQAVKLLNDNGYRFTNDVQVSAVSNEWPNKGDENYLVAVRTK